MAKVHLSVTVDYDSWQICKDNKLNISQICNNALILESNSYKKQISLSNLLPKKEDLIKKINIKRKEIKVLKKTFKTEESEIGKLTKKLVNSDQKFIQDFKTILKLRNFNLDIKTKSVWLKLFKRENIKIDSLEKLQKLIQKFQESEIKDS